MRTKIIAVVAMSLIILGVYFLRETDDVEIVPPIRVSGQLLLNSEDEEVRLKGVRLFKNKLLYDSFNGKYTQDDFRNLAGWGFNVIEIDMYWGEHVEPDEDIPGSYSSGYLDLLDPYIRMAEEEGLFVILTLSAVNSDDHPADYAGWGRHSYVCTREGLERYTGAVEFLVNETVRRGWDNVVAFEPYQFPFHQSSPTPEEKEFYYGEVRQRLVEAVRKTSDRLVILSTIHCKLDEFNSADMVPVDDSNSLYAFTYYYYEGMTHGDGPITEWDYDEELQRELLESAVAWKDRYAAPLFCTEWGVRGDSQPQIDLAEMKAGLLEEFGVSWLYHSYENFYENHFGLLYQDNSPKPILDSLSLFLRTEYDDA